MQQRQVRRERSRLAAQRTCLRSKRSLSVRKTYLHTRSVVIGQQSIIPLAVRIKKAGIAIDVNQPHPGCACRKIRANFQLHFAIAHMSLRFSHGSDLAHFGEAFAQKPVVAAHLVSTKLDTAADRVKCEAADWRTDATSRRTCFGDQHLTG